MLGSRNRQGRRRVIAIAFAAWCTLTLPLQAETPTAASKDATTAQRALNDQAQDIKKQALELNRDLFSLEEELLFPANTQVAVFVSLDTGEFFQLDAVQIKLDDKIVANYLYTAKQVDALHRGGVQRLYVGNVKGGKHEIVAVLTGRGPHNRDYRRGATYTFDKADQPKYLELKIVDSTANYEPEFQIKEWQ
ncbi:MAG TPA: AraC family transcriptional regulator [Spongiibacteraceae bacterium]|jgi:exonuclease VII large subunit